jgi:hypothetical protein
MTKRSSTVKTLTDAEIEAAIEEYQENEEQAREERAELLAVLSYHRAAREALAQEVKRLRTLSIDIRGGRIAADATTLHNIEEQLDAARRARDAKGMDIAESKRQLDELCDVSLSPWSLDDHDLLDALRTLD